MTTRKYVHGYSEREAGRLCDQAGALERLLHHDTVFAPGSLVLEAGCGVGAQTRIIAPANPDCHFVSVDISHDSLAGAKSMASVCGISNVDFRQADIFDLPYEDRHFDAAMFCFVLEHLSDPVAALRSVAKKVRPGGTVVVIEGDHGSSMLHPYDENAMAAIRCLVALQRSAGGDADIGRSLRPMLVSAGLADVSVSPRMVYCDAGDPGLQDAFVLKTFTAMVEGVADAALAAGMMARDDWDSGIAALKRSSEPDGVFCYTFFKAVASVA